MVEFNFIPGTRKVLLQKHSKDPVGGIKWGEEDFDVNDKKLKEHLKNGGNYGEKAGGNNIRFLDIDDKELDKKVFEEIIDTRVHETCGGNHHYIFESPYDENREVEKVGEYRAKDQYIVGAGSYVNEGNKKKKRNGYYKVVRDLPIKKLSREEMKNLVDKYLGTKKAETNIVEGEITQEEVSKDFLQKNVMPKLSDKVKELILLTGERGSRSEKNQQLVTYLLLMGMGKYIKAIFDFYPCGQKYREKKTSGMSYLNATIKAGMSYTGISQSVVSELDNDFENIDPKILRNNHAKYIEKISTINNELIQEHFISRLSKLISMSVKNLSNKLLQLSEVERVLHDWKDIKKIKVEELEYWVNPILPKNSIIFIGGSQGVTKSLLVQIMLEGFMKNNYLFKNFEIKDRPNILFYSLEMSLNQLGRRSLYFENGNVLGDDNFDEKKFKVVEKFNVKNLKAERELAKDFDMIVIDSHRRVLEGNENDSEVTNKLYTEFIKPLRDAGKTIIIIFHFNKTKLESYNSEEIMRAFRGSSDIGAEPDIAYGIFKWNEESSSTIKKFDTSVLIGKVRDDYPICPFKLNFTLDFENKKTMINDISTKGVIPVVLSPKQKRENRIIVLVRERGEIETKELIDIIALEFSCAKSSVEKDLKKLVTDEWLEKSEHGVYKFTTPLPPGTEKLDLDEINEEGEVKKNE